MKILPRIMILLAFMLPLGADDLPVVTLDEAITAAADSNIGLQQAAITLNQTIRNADNLLTTYLPTMSLTGGISTGASFPGVYNALRSSTSTDTSFNGLSFSAGATVQFGFAGSMITDAASRRISKEGAALTYETRYDSIEAAITAAYWNLAAADIAIENATLTVEDAQRSYDSTLEMYESGMADELALSQTELALENAKYTLQTYMDQKTLLLSSFRAMTGLEGDFTTEPLPDPVLLSLPSPEELFAMYSETTAAIRTARNSLASAENAKDTAAMTQYVPTIGLDVRYSYSGATGEDNVWDYYHHTGNGLTGSLTVSVPLSSYIPGSSADQTRRNAADQVQIMALGVKDAQDTLLQTIREASLTIGQQADMLTMAERSRDIAQRTYDLAEEAFDAGLMSANDLSSARMSLLSAEISMVSASLNHLLSCYDLAYALGMTIDGLQETYPATIEETV